MITKEELAARLNGRNYPNWISEEEIEEAKAAGLVVIAGQSDDLAELGGAISDEAYVYGSSDLLIDAEGLLPREWEDVRDDEKIAAAYLRRKESAARVSVRYDHNRFDWWISSDDLPYAPFDILEDGTHNYCRGVVIHSRDLPQALDWKKQAEVYRQETHRWKEALTKAEALQTDVMLNKILTDVANKLPSGYQLDISIVRGEADIELTNPDGETVDVCRDDLSATEIIDALCEAASKGGR